MRLDVYVAEHWPQHSRSTWKKLIENGHVAVNGDPELSTKRQVLGNDVVVVTLPEEPDHSQKTLPVIYEDANVIVIDKPEGVLTHSKGALNDEFTVAEFIRSKTSYKTDTNRPGIIHRLDRATSGVIVCAKNRESASMLQKQFSNRTVKKIYIAIVSGHLEQDSAILDLPIGRNPSKPSTFRVDSSGKSAQTFYEVVQATSSRSMVRLLPKTGRTHQLRVHMAYLQAPILGDVIYNGPPFDRLMLHAHSIELTLPGGVRKTFTAPLPVIFTEAVS